MDLGRCYPQFRVARGMTGLAPQPPKGSCLAEPSIHLGRLRHKTSHLKTRRKNNRPLSLSLALTLTLSLSPFFFLLPCKMHSTFHSQCLKWPSVSDFYGFPVDLFFDFIKCLWVLRFHSHIFLHLTNTPHSR